MLGGLYLGGGDGPRPTVLLLHGVPGVEKNLDLAYALRDAGWNCLYFHYRGCWGSEGVYDLGGLVDDVRAATDWLVKQPAVDAERLALVGNSLGGYTTLAAGAADPRFKALVPICPLLEPAAAPLSERLTLLVTAQRDELFPPAHYQRLLSALPGLAHRQIAGTG